MLAETKKGAYAALPEQALPDIERKTKAQPQARQDGENTPTAVPVLKNRVKIFALVLAMAALFGIVIGRYALLSETTLEVDALKQNLVETQIEAEHKRLMLSMAVSLSDVQNIARDKLSMNYPSQDQINFIEVELPKPEEEQKQSGPQASEVPDTNWFDTLLGLLD